MEIIREQIDGVLILTPQGTTIDAANIKDFKKEMASTCEPNSKQLLDMSKIQFIDSAGIGGLLSHLRQIGTAKAELKLCSITKQVRALFELVRLHHLFDIYNTREEALKAFHA